MTDTGSNAEKKPYARHILSFLQTALVTAAAAGISIALRSIGVREENILMVFLVGVLIVVVETRGYLWGILASVFSVAFFNFFFTAPYYTFHINDPNYIVSILIFLIVSVIAGMLTTRLQRQAFIAKYNEQQSEALYNISAGFVHVSGLENSIRYSLHCLYRYFGINCVFYPAAGSAALQEPIVIKEDFADISVIEDGMAAAWVLAHGAPAGQGTGHFEGSQWRYIPVRSTEKVYGVIAVFGADHDTLPRAMVFVTTVVSQMALVIERERLNVEREKDRLEIEKEKLRGNLLRAISHDLRTPLTGIAGASGFMAESYDRLDRETVLGLLRDIETDSRWLVMMVENLLNMTRIQEGRLAVSKQREVADDVVSEAVARAVRKDSGHPVSIHVPEDILLVPMDPKLIVQVLVNLLDNAVKHTPAGTSISVTVSSNGNSAVFEVADTGPGIREDIAGTLFDSFVSAKSGSADSCRGMGLGLSICRAIVEAHGGTISACSADGGGAVFTFSLPLETREE